MKHCPRAVSIARPSTLQLTALPSELAAAPGQRVDCKKMCEIKRVGCIKGQVKGGLRKNVQN